ncbi:MAG: dockerin type I repeat-containing protein [Oscillospiraceae bacterium]|nr:dockerin type I repeat-containing protein [Oscillospiraceae bacterium]
MKEWKTAGALLLAGAIVFMQGIVPTQTQITAKAETLTYYETEDINDGYYGGDCTGSVTTACSYTITENQSWDDTLGEPVDDKYITIVNIDIIADISVPTYLFTYAIDDPYYASYGSIRYGSMDLSQSWIDWEFTLNYTIPAEIDGIPVRIIDASITYKTYGNSDRYPTVHVIVPEEIKTIQKLTDSNSFNPCCLHLPSTVQKIGTLHLKNWNIQFDGTCAELFAAYPYIQEGDGKFICTDGKLNLNNDVSISYDGTCAQWVEICPVNLVYYAASCSDGTVITEVGATTTVPIVTTPEATTTSTTTSTTSTTSTTITTTELPMPPLSTPEITTTTAAITTTTVPTITVTVHYGDADCNGNLNIMDVILLNRYLMIGAPVSLSGMLNADVDGSGTIDSVDSLNILKAVVQLITLPVA